MSLLFPACCVGCGAFLIDTVDMGVCGVCWQSWEPNEGQRCGVCDAPAFSEACFCASVAWGFDAVRAPWLYGGCLADLLHACKFGGREDVAYVCARMLASALKKEGLEWGAGVSVQPVPLSVRSKRSRGFNQSAVLARGVSRVCGVPLKRTLSRVRETGRQSLLQGRAQRIENMRGAFESKPVEGTVLLVDDVVTTGATVHEAALALKKAGADRVCVLALARTV